MFFGNNGCGMHDDHGCGTNYCFILLLLLLCNGGCGMNGGIDCCWLIILILLLQNCDCGCGKTCNA